MSVIDSFAEELRRRVQERDPKAMVKILKTMTTPLTGEYLCLIESGGNVETYAFNPSKQEWTVVYNI